MKLDGDRDERNGGVVSRECGRAVEEEGSG